MRDLTKGSVQSHLVRLALPIMGGMVFQTLYYLVDLYFVSRLGDVAIAGVAAAGNLVFLVMALTQTINTGTLALLSHAVGRKDHERSNLVFNQALALAAAFTLATLVFGHPLATAYMETVGADKAAVGAGMTYLAFFLPGLALQFLMTAMGAVLRATGIAKPILIVQAASVSLNILLAPILIAGWLTGRPLGVAGAGLASSLSVAAGVSFMLFYLLRLETYVHFVAADWLPRLAIWRRIFTIGLPAGGEFAFLFLYTAVIYAVIRHFGDAAQAGFGVGNRLTQAIFLPCMAIAFAAAPVAGQNFGAQRSPRVRATLRAAILSCTVIMLPFTVFCQLRPDLLVRVFTQEPDVVAQGALFLGIVSWNFVATGIIFSCSALFQGLGNTWPALLSTSSRLLTFVVPAVLMSASPRFRIEDVWYLSVATVTLQALFSLYLVTREMRRRLPVETGEEVPVAVEV